jgi:hypothetical protein
MATRRWNTRLVVCGALLAVVVVAGYRIQPPWWDNAADIQEMHDAVADGTGYEGTDEYVPAGADASELNKEQPLVVASSGRRVKTEVAAWRAVEKHLVIQAQAPELLTLRLFNYPAWEVAVNGEHIATQTTEVTGQMIIPVAAGRGDIRIHFGRTRDRTLGGLISVLSLGVWAGVWITTRRPL